MRQPARHRLAIPRETYPASTQGYDQFQRWLIAPVGCVCYLTIDPLRYDDGCPHATRLKALARRALEAGLVTLTQRRIEGRVQFLAIARAG